MIPPPTRKPTLPGFEEWLEEQGLTRNTIDQRLDFVQRQLRSWGTFDVRPSAVLEWLGHYEGWTRVTYFNHAVSVYAFLVESGELAKSPMARMRKPARPGPHPKPLLPEQVRTVLDNADGDLLAWLQLAYLSGLRAHEIAKVRGEDVSPAALYVVGKGGKAVALPTHPALWETAQSYPRIGWWFPNPATAHGHVTSNSISTRIGRYMRSLGVTERGAIHRLRHSYCTQLSRNGIAPRVIQELMRHSSLETTQMYIDVDSTEKRFAIETLVA